VQLQQGSACLSGSHVALRMDGHADGVGEKDGRVHKGGALCRVWPEIIDLQFNGIAIRITVIAGLTEEHSPEARWPGAPSVGLAAPAR